VRKGHDGLAQRFHRRHRRGIRTKRLAQTAQGAGMELRHPRLVDAEFGADFLHRDFAVVVEGDDAALTRGQRADGATHAVLHFLPLVGGIGTLGLHRHEHLWQLGFVDVVGARERRGLLDGVDADDHLAEALFVGAHGLGEVGQRRLVAERQAQLLAGGLELTAHAAHTTRPGVLAERVDHRAAHATLGEGLELDAARFLEALGGVDEANDPVLHQVAQVDRVRHGGGHSTGQCFHEGEPGFDAGVDLFGSLLGGHWNRAPVGPPMLANTGHSCIADARFTQHCLTPLSGHEICY